MNPYDEYVQCPYDPSHVQIRSRIQTHIIKCARSHPNSNLEICPFNTTHRYPPEILKKHMEDCDSREIMDRSMYNMQRTSNAAAAANPVSRPQLPPKPNDDEEEDGWNNDNYPSYDPKLYAENARVIRQTPHVIPSQRRQHRDKERNRWSRLERESKAT